jgi:two-component system, NarL family, sensor kinase
MDRNFRLLRYYSITSLFAIVAVALLLSLFYRQVAYHGILQLAERSNLSLARTALNSMRPALVEYLNSVLDLGTEGVKNHPLPHELAASINDLMQGDSVVRIKIYNRRGVVAFSTETSQIGGDLSRYSHFISAMKGNVTSRLNYHDTLDVFEQAGEDDNLMQTYIPVRASATDPILGVFEIYTDANNLVYRNDRIEIILLVGAVLILSGLYFFLVLVVRRARDVIDLQQKTIRERTQTLEMLSAQMLVSEEAYKKKIAVELHEGLAQTLAAIKLIVENGRHAMKQDNPASRSLEQVIPVLQNVIHEVQALATELRPASLDDFGLLATIDGLCREFERRHPEIRIKQQTSLQEDEIPAPLKVIVYRIVMLALNDIEQYTSSDALLLTLMRTTEGLTVTIDNTPSGSPDGKTTESMGSRLNQQPRFAKMVELATLSGGTFKATRNSAGGIILKAVWGWHI